MRDISDMKAFLFYIKCAAPHPRKPNCSSIRFNLHTEKDGIPTWTLLGDSKILAMEKGTGVWKSYAAAGDGNALTPNYLRLSQAERDRKERMQKV